MGLFVRPSFLEGAHDTQQTILKVEELYPYMVERRYFHVNPEVSGEFQTSRLLKK